MSFNIPILFLIFNRLDTTKQVFEKIRRISPQKLYLASDGPRDSKEGEADKVKIVRDFVINSIDWDCDVKTLFRESNLGCGKAVSQAINWFFDNEEMGIVLEDDCLPSDSFFSYCEELLIKYKDNENIYHIAGFNPLTITKSKYSYYFARAQHCWGWASWKRAWKKYNFDITDLDLFIKEKRINKIFTRNIDRNYWINIFRCMESHQIDTWDYQWTYTIFNNNGICINPSKNLISNIGFGNEATHTTGSNNIYNNQERFEIDKLIPAENIKINNRLLVEINKYAYRLNYKVSIKKIIKKVLQYIMPPLFNLDGSLKSNILKRSFNKIFNFRILKKKKNIEKKYSYGNDNKDKIFYLLGRNWDDGGLMAVVFYSLPHFIYAEKKGYKAIMDLKNYSWQYTQKDITDIENAWEYYFEQPFGYSLEDTMKSRNVYKQNYVFPQVNDCIDWRFIWEKSEKDRNDYINYLKEKFRKYIRFNSDTKKYLEEEYKSILKEKNNVLGVLCRGTDYIIKKPEYHPIQPEPAEAIEIVESIVVKKKCSYIYLATEDSDIYDMFKKHFGDTLLSNNQLRFKKSDLAGEKLLYEVKKNRRDKDAYITGLEYISTLYLLSKCSCFFGGITGGTIGVLCMTDGFDYKYLYYKGLYTSIKNMK